MELEYTMKNPNELGGRREGSMAGGFSQGYVLEHGYNSFFTFL